MPIRDVSSVPALFRFAPDLAAKIPHRSILVGPTPVKHLAKLSREVGRGAEIWIKRDDRSSPVYGGNKPRKLEFLIGDALARRARSLVTFGVVGSHHALATAIFGAEAGLDTTAVLLPGPLHPHGIENLRRTCLRAKHTLYLDLRGLPRVAGAVIPALVGDASGSYLIPPGGSSPIGNLGYVSAALELAEQVRAGLLPKPDYVFVAAGSLGTLSGLVTGFALAGLETWVVGIAVIGPPSVSTDRVDALVRRVRARLIAVAPELKRLRHGFERRSIFFGSLGRGYGHATEAGARAASILAEREGITLDTTYTAKTMAGILDWLDRSHATGKNILYWHTLSSAPVTEELSSLPTEALPPPLDRLVAAAETSSG